MRLDRRLAQATGLSRTQAQRAIRAGQVSVNNQVVKDAAAIIADSAEVVFAEEILTTPGPRYLMLHKPAGVVCANHDPIHRTVFDLLGLPNPAGLHVAGRLDLDTTGLVLITDDGAWLHRITSPRQKLPKTYRARLAEPLTAEARHALEAGVLLEGEPKACAPAVVEPVTEREIRLTLTEGKYHQVKRMLTAVGNHVEALHRERIGAIVLDVELPEGRHRPLTAAERQLQP